jgi:succinate dehydrogenase/fumarate reductase flavoprotein subunit
MDIVSTDVLVIGSGLTGLCAAIACKKKGLDVLVCSKASPGLGNCSVVSRGAFRSSGGGISAREHQKATLASGHGLNDGEKWTLWSRISSPPWAS